MTLLAISILLGLLLGLTGAGGSIFAVPLLVVLLGMETPQAMTLALAAVCVGAGYGAYIQRKNILWFPSFFLILGGVFTAPLGKLMANQTDPMLLSLGFCLLASFIAIKSFRQALLKPEMTRVLRGAPSSLEDKSSVLCRLNPEGQFQLKLPCVSGVLAGGLLVGFTSGFFGVGGGFLIVPFLLWLSQISMRDAVASSLVSITLISAAALVSQTQSAVFSDLRLLGFLVAGALIGMIVSRPLGNKLAGPRLQIVFSALLVLASVILAINTLG